MNIKEALKNYGCLTLFFLPFVAGFLYLQYYIVSNVCTMYKTRNWIEIPAKINFTDQVYSSSKGSSSSQTIVEYSYVYNQEAHTNKKIGFFYHTDNIEDHAGIYTKLESADSVLAYVNPLNPTEAVLTTTPSKTFYVIIAFDLVFGVFLTLFLFIPLFIKNKFKNNLIFDL